MGILSAFRFAFQNVFFTPVLYGVIASLAVFSTTWEKADRIKDQLSDRHRSQQDTFDFIIVGGGSAGSVLANRLSKYHTVLLLEAGGESHPFQAIPALSLFIPNYPATDWSHKSPPQTTSCLSCVHKKYTFSQGKNLGGSGNLNYLIHLRGSPKDFDNWARITGDPRWTYTNVKTDFCTSEHFVGTTTDASAHGVGGPLQIEMPSEIGLANEWNWAGQEMGYRHLDLNGNYDEGFDALYYPIKHGVRQATYRAYIQPVRRRANLLIRKFAHVNKVLIREGTNDAYGVSYDRHGKAKYAFANKEIILSAGTLQTPKILMLSGIGPRTVLEPLHIPVKADLPVGKNLHDHISTLVGPFLVNSKKPFSYDDDVTPGSFLKFTTQGKGPLTTSGFQATALVASSYAKAKGQIGWPDIQLTLFGMSPHRLFASDFAHAFGLREDILQRFLLHSRGKSAFFILVSVARPESRGEFCITSKDPYKAPIIDPHYYSDPNGNDIKVMLEGIQRALFIAENTTIFQNCGTKFVSKSLPGCENHPFRSDGYWECYARHLSITLNDHVGTASMGYETSPFAVVDSELRVMRVNNLRVVDASVMPAIVGANTQASTIMIAEKIAAILLDKWKDFRTTDPNQAQYGPPPLPTQPGVVNEQYGVPGVTPGDPNSQYGPPGALPVTKDATQSNSNVKVVPDDSLGSLRPPLVDSVDTYGNYDSFNLLKNKGFPPPEGLALGQSSPSSITPEFVQNPSTSPAPSPITTPGFFSPSISSTPVPSRGLKAPGQSDPNFYQQFPTPPIYNEVYDPVYSTSQTTLASPFPDSQTTAISSPTRGRGSKSYEFPPTLNSIQEVSTSPENIEPTQQSLLTRGPNGQVIVRRRKRPPNVTVHPRGHLGYEDTSRNNREYPNSTTPNSIFPSTSIHPLPKEVVTIRQRRPVYPTRRRRLKTSAATTTPAVFSEAEHFEVVDQEVGADNGNGFTGYNQNQLTTPVTRLDVDTSTNRNVRFIPSANSTSVSKSVSAVINRLRNFIPPSGGGNSPSQTASRAKRGQNSIMDRLIRDRKSNLKNLHNNVSKDTESDKNKTNENSNTQEDIEGAESEEMIIFSDVKVELGDTNSTKKEDEDHPFMPMDMDPVPKIIASSKKMLLISPEQRILNISRFKKRKRAN